MDRLKIFEKEIEYIKDKNIKTFTEQTILKLPEYFFTVASSSTGKYHPKFSLGEGGLIRHVKCACTIAMDLMQLEMMNNYTDLEKDVVICSFLLHDGLKHGLEGGKYTVAEHPLLIAEFVSKNKELSSLISEDILEVIVGCLRGHMGEFNIDYQTKKEILPKPKGKLQNFVHLCDYLSSKKYFEEFNFDISVLKI